nr:HAMP domain-containing sensor histidine kinase [Deinococcus aestuarii]
MRTRLVRAFTLVSLPALLLLAGVTFLYARHAYLALRRGEVLRELDNNIRRHHRATGSLAGLQPQEPPLEERNLEPQRRPPPPSSLPPFLVLDPAFRVVGGVAGYPAGTVLPAARRAGLREVRVNGRPIAYLYATGTPPPLDAQSRAFLQQTALLLLAAVGLSALLATGLGAAVSRHLLAPLRALQRGVRSLTVGRAPHPLPAGPPDELGELLAAFNAMTAELERRRVAGRQFSADIAHDLTTPLSVMRASLEAMLEGTLTPTPGRLARLHAQTGHLLHLTGDLRLLSLADAGDLTLHRREVDVARLLGEVAAAFEDRAGQAGVTLTVQAAGGPPARVDPVRITQVLHNLMQNALNHTPAGGTVTLTAGVRGGGWRLTVQDTGRGIAPGHLERVFDRLHRVDEARTTPGSGLGLSIARTLAEAHGGTLTLESRVGGGTTATLTLPRGSPAPPPGV